MKVALTLSAILLFSALSLRAEDKRVGRYAKEIKNFQERWLKPETNLNVTEKSNELLVQSINTPEDNTYVGVLAKTTVKAKLSAVIKVLRDLRDYKNIYPGLDELSYENAADVSQIHWKFSGPMGTHTIYDTTQSVSETAKTKGTLIYHLKESNDVLDADGFIFLQETDGMTKYISVDFFNAKWGMAGTFFKNKIWETTFDNTKKATLAIKSKAEKSSEKVSENYVGLDDREKQKTFGNLENDIFDKDTHTP